MEKELHQALLDAHSLLGRFIAEPNNIAVINQVVQGMASAFKSGHKIMICGNGGSSADAMHFAEEFTGRFRSDRRALPVMHLCDACHVTCVSNDYGFEQIFARGVQAYGLKGDWLVLLSTSGNSSNVILAEEAAKKLGINTFALLGKNGGILKGRSHHELIIPHNYADRIQEIHMLILHVIIEGVERILFPENYGVKASLVEN